MATNRITTKNNIGGPSGGVVLKYLGLVLTKDSNGIRTTQLTYQSTKDKLISAVNNLNIGGYDDSISGYLTDINIKQLNGPFWNAVLTYSSTWSNQITIHIGSVSGPTNYTCTTIMKSLALLTKDNYCYIWNHMLIYLDTKTSGGTAYSPPQWSAVSGLNNSNYKDIINDPSNNGHLKWIKEANEMPTDPVYEETVGANNETVQVPHYWKIAYECTKPGVDYYEFPTYEITESSRSTQQPTWWKNNLPGKIIAPSNTFGIDTGLWLCHGGQIRYDGKAYEASCTYLWTPGEWDRELYDEATNNNNGGKPILPEGD